MTGDDRNVHGIAPKFSDIVDTLLDLDERAVTMQTVHRRKRGGLGAACGDTLGQLSPLGTGITCTDPKCSRKK